MELQSVSDTDHVNKVFGHCIINWKIENFCLATCKDDWILFTSVFYVGCPEPTKWKMFLEPTPKENDTYSIKLNLQRLEYEGPDVVWANWKLFLLDSNEKEICKTECEYFFDKKSEFGVDLQNIGYVLNKFRPLDSDTLIIRCQMIASPEGSNKNWEKPNIGLRSLSQDLGSLYRRGKFHDVVLSMHGKDIRAHKSILQSRNNVLAAIIQEDPGVKVIPLSLDYKAIEKIVSYLYSGNLECVLAKPTISLHECVLILDINEIKAFYVPEELVVHTEIDVQEYALLWLISDFDSRVEDCIVSPVLNNGISEISWRFLLFPNGNANVEYIGIYAESIEVKKSMDVCVEFAIMNTNLESFCLKRFRKSFASPQQLGFDDFAPRDMLYSSLLFENTLRIVCKIRMSSGVQTSSISSHMSAFVTSNKKTTYDSLSSNMDAMFKTGNFKDVTVFVDRTQIKVHKCILAARSKVLTNMLNPVSDSESVVRISNVHPNVMRVVLNYLYSASLGNIDLDDVPNVYEAAKTFALDSLRDTCVQYLHNNIRLETVCDILVFASKNKEKELKLSVLKFMSEDSNAVFSQDKWVQLVASKPFMCADVIEYLRNNPGTSKT